MATERAGNAILLAVDGEPHTDAAVQWAIELAVHLRRQLVAVHVKDPYLKQFYNEIYAQGRQAYLDHVDDCLETVARQAIARFEAAVGKAVPNWRVKTLSGDPLEELCQEVQCGQYELLVMGRRIKRKRFDNWRSRNLPRKLMEEIQAIPVLIVPG